MFFDPRKSLRKFVSIQKAARGLTALVVGTALAFLLLFLFPLARHNLQILTGYITQALPLHAGAMATTIAIGLVAIIILTAALRIWHSLRLGLLRFRFSVSRLVIPLVAVADAERFTPFAPSLFGCALALFARSHLRDEHGLIVLRDCAHDLPQQFSCWVKNSPETAWARTLRSRHRKGTLGCGTGRSRLPHCEQASAVLGFTSSLGQSFTS